MTNTTQTIEEQIAALQKQKEELEAKAREEAAEKKKQEAEAQRVAEREANKAKVDAQREHWVKIYTFIGQWVVAVAKKRGREDFNYEVTSSMHEGHWNYEFSVQLKVNGEHISLYRRDRYSGGTTWRVGKVINVDLEFMNKRYQNRKEKGYRYEDLAEQIFSYMLGKEHKDKKSRDEDINRQIYNHWKSTRDEKEFYNSNDYYVGITSELDQPLRLDGRLRFTGTPDQINALLKLLADNNIKLTSNRY